MNLTENNFHNILQHNNAALIIQMLEDGCTQQKIKSLDMFSGPILNTYKKFIEIIKKDALQGTQVAKA